jgi:hypothetical protein
MIALADWVTSWCLLFGESLIWGQSILLSGHLNPIGCNQSYPSSSRENLGNSPDTTYLNRALLPGRIAPLELQAQQRRPMQSK